MKPYKKIELKFIYFFFIQEKVNYNLKHVNCILYFVLTLGCYKIVRQIVKKKKMSTIQFIKLNILQNKNDQTQQRKFDDSSVVYRYDQTVLCPDSFKIMFKTTCTSSCFEICAIFQMIWFLLNNRFILKNRFRQR